MEKTLAVITVVISDEPLGDYGSSGSGPRGNDGVHWEVRLLPNADKALDPELWKANNATETVLAHELGHIVSRIFHDPDDSTKARRLAQWIGPSAMIPAEKKAWKNAEIIYPQLDKATKDRALKAYGAEVQS
jgi:hypothetical protein